eukprot:GEMP01036485.1.p1 GENE.GEMP01036485.1~~GEMP01036485.1.p1  ORF type:complete len:297 (+),score=50.45 GEMP01036485.1:152-1042(+)
MGSRDRWSDWVKASTFFGQLRQHYPRGIIITGGNHDHVPTRINQFLELQRLFAGKGIAFVVDEMLRIPVGDDKYVTLFVSPLSFYRGYRSCAFQAHRQCEPEPSLKASARQLLPDDIEVIQTFPECSVDILITHGPPFSIGDSRYGDLSVEFTGSRPCVGSRALLDYVMTYPPRYHVFGDCHADCGDGSDSPEFERFGHGVKRIEEVPTVFINCAVAKNLGPGVKEIKRGAVLLDVDIDHASSDAVSSNMYQRWRGQQRWRWFYGGTQASQEKASEEERVAAHEQCRQLLLQPLPS